MPAYYGFCPSERAWKREMKRLCPKVSPPEDYPTADGRATSFEEDGKLCIIVTLNERIDRKDRGGIFCLIVHEATHVWQMIRRDINEREPSVEFEAYAMQAIVMNLCKAYGETRRRLW